MGPAEVARLGDLLGTPVAAARDLGGQHGVRHYRLRLADGRLAFAKAGNGPLSADAASLGFAAEAAGLRWLADARSVPVPAVLFEPRNGWSLTGSTRASRAGNPASGSAASSRVCTRRGPTGSARRGQG